MEWTDETIARLRDLWAEGLSTAEIGRRMGISKNAVVGKAHRVGLEPRPSPIRREGSAVPLRPSPARRMTGPTLPPLTAEAPVAPPPPAPRPAIAAVRAEPPRPVPPVRPVPVRTVRTHTCCWPLGDPGTRSFRFCDAEASSGKPVLRRTRLGCLCEGARQARGSRGLRV